MPGSHAAGARPVEAHLAHPGHIAGPGLFLSFTVRATANKNSFLDSRFFWLESSSGRWRSKTPSAEALEARVLPARSIACPPRPCHHTWISTKFYGWSYRKRGSVFGHLFFWARIAELAMGIKITKCHEIEKGNIYCKILRNYRRIYGRNKN